MGHFLRQLVGCSDFYARQLSAPALRDQFFTEVYTTAQDALRLCKAAKPDGSYLFYAEESDSGADGDSVRDEIVLSD